MGVIIQLQNNVNHYASINTNSIEIRKNKEYPLLGANGLEGGDNIEISDEIVTYYIVSGSFNVWNDETKYKENEKDSTLCHVQDVRISVKSDTIPTNIYSTLYEKFKTGLVSYTDDI